MAQGFRIGCDIGGTFTDFVLIEMETGRVRTAKRLTTSDDPSHAMLAGLTELGLSTPVWRPLPSGFPMQQRSLPMP